MTTMKDLLQELLNETQGEMATYRQLAEKKKKKKKLMQAYRHLQFRELSLKDAIRKIEGGRV